MSYFIAYQQQAKSEYESAIHWYRERSELAAENFELAVKEKIEILRSTPDLYKQSYKQFREVTLRRYPYSLIYLINEKDQIIIISSVYHHKRHPKSKFRN